MDYGTMIVAFVGDSSSFFEMTAEDHRTMMLMLEELNEYWWEHNGDLLGLAKGLNFNVAKKNMSLIEPEIDDMPKDKRPSLAPASPAEICGAPKN